MKTKLMKLAARSVLAATVLTFTSCSTTDESHKTTSIETPEGATIVDTHTVSGTIFDIDTAKRKVTLLEEGRVPVVYKAGPNVNLDQLHVRDHVKVNVTEQVAVFVGQGAPPSAVADAQVALAPAGAKPVGVLVDTKTVTAQVTAVHPSTHKVTFQLPDGTKKTVKAGKNVDVSAAYVGQNVTLQLSEGLALTVEKP